MDDTSAVPELEPVRNGIDCLAADGFAALGERRIALVAGDQSLLLDGQRTIDALAAQSDASLYIVYEPDFSAENREVASDAATGTPVFTLDGSEQRPDE